MRSSSIAETWSSPSGIARSAAATRASPSFAAGSCAAVNRSISAVAADGDNEAEARRATSVLYHVGSAIALTWEAARIHAARGDARRLLLAKLVVDHRLTTPDPFAVGDTAQERVIAEVLFGKSDVAMKEVSEIMAA